MSPYWLSRKLFSLLSIMYSEMGGDASSDIEPSDGLRRQVTMPSSKKATFAINRVNAKALEVIKINSRSKLFALMPTLKYKLRISMTKATPNIRMNMNKDDSKEVIKSMSLLEWMQWSLNLWLYNRFSRFQSSHIKTLKWMMSQARHPTGSDQMIIRWFLPL